VFPALDHTGAVRYLQARGLNPGNGPKYLNPAAELAANPRLAWAATTEPARPRLLVICEGIPDSLTAAQAGYRAVAVLGSHTPDATVAAELARRAHRDHYRLVAIPDNDDAGHAWGHRLERLLGAHGAALTVVTPPLRGADLNDWARHDPNWTASIVATIPTRWMSVRAARRAAPGNRGIELT
jgi:DNA primase